MYINIGLSSRIRMANIVVARLRHEWTYRVFVYTDIMSHNVGFVLLPRSIVESIFLYTRNTIRQNNIQFVSIKQENKSVLFVFVACLRVLFLNLVSE